MPLRKYKRPVRKRPRRKLQRSLLLRAPPTYRFVRSVIVPTVSVTCPIGPGFASNSTDFRLSYLPNYTEFTAMFDSYRIRTVSVTMTPCGTGSDTATGYSRTPMFYAIKDYDDITPIGDRDELAQRGCLIKQQFIKPITIRMNPRSRLDAGGSAYSGMSARNTWLDCTYPNVPHYGLKFAWASDTATSNVIYYDVATTYVLEFRATR